MGNCLLGGMGDGGRDGVIRVATSNGGVMEFHTPVTAEFITDGFPGHGIFRSHDLFWRPLPHTQLLIAGESYHLLPVMDLSSKEGGLKAGAGAGHVRSNSAPQIQSAVAPYRMSFHSPGRVTKNGGAAKFWKVKLVINPEQLVEILSEAEKTEELIESVRTVGKCGSSVYGFGCSDVWSFASSRNGASSNQDSANLVDL